VVVLGEVTLTASALHLLLERDIEITFLGPYGQFKGRLSPPFSKNALLRLAQYRAETSSESKVREVFSDRLQVSCEDTGSDGRRGETRADASPRAARCRSAGARW